MPSGWAAQHEFITSQAQTLRIQTSSSMGTAGKAAAMPGLSEIGDALVAQGLDNMRVTACPCLVAVLFLLMLSHRPSQRM